MASSLNPQQRAAVEHTGSPLLILAGAGSGKTRVITHRIAHLLSHYRTPPHAILAMTFTNKAAQEMQERVAGLLSYRAGAAPQISTFHAFCVRSLRRDYPAIGGRGDFVIYADDEQQRLLKGLVRTLGFDDKTFAPRKLQARISAAKNRGLTAARYREQALDPTSERIAVVYERYQQALRQANALDFDDLLLETERLLRESAETAARYHERYQHILIDEYQDTNRPQYELMRLLAPGNPDLVVVGDEDQSIYSWRGAEIRNILDFERDYPGATVIRLEQNYRSTQNILQAAGAVVANNTERKGKVLWTEADAGASIGYYLAPEADAEARFVAETIRAALGTEPVSGSASIAVLYRTNAQSRPFEEALRRLNLSYKVVGGFSFYERAEVRDLLAYLRAAINPADSLAWLRVINVPPRGIGKTTVEAIERVALENNLGMQQAIERALERAAGLPARALPALAEFYKLMAGLRQLALDGATPHALLEAAIERSGYVRMLEEEATPEAEARIENIGELLNATRDATQLGESVAAFLDHAALVSDQDDYDPRAAVQLMSLHAAKGLEFSTVFLVGLEEGLFPHSRSFDAPAQMEEERRLCYVGITRARQRLYLSHSARRRRFGGQVSEPSLPSRFLAEVPQRLLEDLSPPDTRPAPRYVREGYSQEAKPPGGGFRRTFNSVESLHQFFQRPGGNATAPSRPEAAAPRAPSAPAAARGAVSPGGLKNGARVRHAKFGVGTVLRIEGDGELAKLTVSFPGFGLKKMVEKFAALTPV